MELVQDGLQQCSWRTKAGGSVHTHVTSLNCCLVARGLFQSLCIQATYTVVLARASIFMKMVVVVAGGVEEEEGF